MDSPVALKSPSRFAGQANGSAGCRRARQTRCVHSSDAIACEEWAKLGRKKSLRGGATRQAHRPEGWTSRRTKAKGLGSSTRTTPRGRRTAARHRRVQHKANLVRGSCQRLQWGPGEKQKTRWLAAYRVFRRQLRRPKPPVVEALGKQFSAISARRISRSRRHGGLRRHILQGQELVHRTSRE